MAPRFAVLLVAATLAACAGKGGGEPTVLATESVRDPSGAIEVEMAYRNHPKSHVELSFRLRALGTDEMDKLVLDIDLQDLHVVEGSTEWTGFVPPRQPQSHSVVLVLAEGAEFPRATVSVRRSLDSELLMQRELAFRVSGSGLEPVE